MDGLGASRLIKAGTKWNNILKVHRPVSGAWETLRRCWHRHTSFHCTSLDCNSKILLFFFFFLNELKVGGGPASNKSRGHFFSGICSFYVLCHILVILAIFHTSSKKIITDWRLRWWLAFLAIKYLKIKVCTLYFFFYTYCYCTLNGLQYNVNVTLICTGKPKNSRGFIAVFILLWCPGTEPVLSLRFAYSCNFTASTINISKVMCKYSHSNCSVYLHSNISLKLCLQSGGPT